MKDPETWRFSPSQIKTFRRCKRVWAFEKILGIKQPTKPAAAKGSRVHAVLEDYYEGGLPPDPKTDEGRIASYALPHLPDPHPAMVVEENFVFSFGGLNWTGKIDLNWDPEIVATDRVFAWPHDIDHIISDHKTSRDPGAYGLSEGDLPTDEQAVIYSMCKFEEIEELEIIGAQWTYLKSVGKGQGIPVRAELHREPIRSEMLKIVETGQEMMDVLRSNLRDANNLPPTPSACGDFGGCDFAKMGVCVLEKSERMAALF